ncbi:hypothetical protein [Streptomyces uncialis]|uniref:hypothetical protein n=1 Tax=Streptomyces uncialis TaxID=1048205 RepID=UPI0037890625
MITENSGLRRPREQLLRFDTDLFEENLRTIVLGLAQEALSEQQAARIALALMIAAPGSLQQGREILRNLADQRTPPTTANGAASDRSRNPAHTHHTARHSFWPPPSSGADGEDSRDRPHRTPRDSPCPVLHPAGYGTTADTERPLIPQEA